jgi:RimJ/RimL family protein N-acetyltransferase
MGNPGEAPDLDGLHLRPLVEADWVRVHEWARREDACRYQPWGPNTPEQTRAFAAAAAAAWTAAPGEALWRRPWVAVLPGAGVVGLGELRTRHAGRVGELSYAVHHEYWGRGVGTRVAALLRDAGFELLALHRVEATCDPRNVASARILRSLGMTLEGTLRANRPIRDGWRDSHVFGLLADEWRALRVPSVAALVSL